MDPYKNCPTFITKSFTIRLISDKDSESLFECYHDKLSVELMNDDNCDFGFFVDTPEKMKETIKYWIEFYQKGYFVRFSIIDNKSKKAIGTIEGFNDNVGVLRVDICKEFEKEQYLSEIFIFAKETFYKMFNNEFIVTKAIKKASQRRKALEDCGYEFINKFRNFDDYYQIKCDK